MCQWPTEPSEFATSITFRVLEAAVIGRKRMPVVGSPPASVSAPLRVLSE